MEETTAVTISFVKEKDTLNTTRYAEVVPDGAIARVRTLYLQKPTVKELGNPESITLTIAAA